MRIVTILLTLVVIILSCGLAYQYNQKAFLATQNLEGERHKRFLLEEDLEITKARVDSLDLALIKAQAEIKKTEVLFKQAKDLNLSLKSRLDEAAELKAMMDQKIAELEKITK